MTDDRFKQKDADAILALCEDNIDELLFIYNMLNPNSMYADVRGWPMLVQLDMPGVNGDVCVAMLQEAARSGAGTHNLHHSSVVISASYSFEAMYSVDQGDLINAWRCLTEARYYCGSYSVNPGLVGARRETLDEGRRHIPSAGGSAKAAKLYGEFRKKVEELALKLRPEDGWRSRAHAVEEIGAAIDADVADPDLASLPTDRTIDGWLRAMPSAGELFPTRRKR